MSQTKSTRLKSYKEKSILDNILWFVDNYLPQKKKRLSRKENRRYDLEPDFVFKIKKFASYRSKVLRGDFYDTKVTFTVGNWAFPYLNILKRLKLLK